jgi:cytochrome P450
LLIEYLKKGVIICDNKVCTTLRRLIISNNPDLIGPKPSEKPLSLLAMLRSMRGNPLAMIPTLAYERPIWERKSIFGHYLLVSDPTGIKHVLVDNVANYPKSPLIARILGTAFGNGLLVSEGDKWRAHRRVIAPAFNSRGIAACAPFVTEAVEARLKVWDAMGKDSQVDVACEMTTLMLEIISRSIFSVDKHKLQDSLDEALRKSLSELNFGFQHIAPMIGPLLMSRKLAGLRANFEAVDTSVKELIHSREKRSGIAPRDLLDRLIDTIDSETDIRMTDNEVRDEVVIAFLAGHETSALAATYAWYLLSLHPEVEAKFHAELETQLGSRTPTFDDLEKLVYTRMVVDETLRLYPPVPLLMSRVALNDDVLCGFNVPRGAEILISPWVTQRHRVLWENPDRFDPDRFSREHSVSRSRYAYLPFGSGPRVCIGAQFALSEVSLVLATIAQRYRLKLIPNQDIVLVHMITQRPRDGISMQLVRRS